MSFSTHGPTRRTRLRGRVPTRTLLALFAVAALGLVTACGGGSPGEEGRDDLVHGGTDDTGSASLVVYSGRSESLVGPLLERYQQATGVTVQARYGETAEMAATLMEEGGASPADVFLSQDAAALGAVADAGLLRPLPTGLSALVPARFADPQSRWVGLSGRARSVVYNTELISEKDLPKSLLEVTDAKHKGTFGVAPLNGSFQAHMAVYRVAHGAEALDELLAGIAANEPTDYPKNSAIVEAVIRGEVKWGLVNHYYLWRALSEDPKAPAKNFFMPAGDASGFINVAGAGVVSDNPAAVELIRWLLAEEAQTYFAEETYEYPLVPGIPPSVDLQSLDELQTPEVDFGQVSDALEATIEAIQASGLLP